MFDCSNHCRFCDIMQGNKKFGLADEPINYNNGYFILPTIGPMVEGWSLIIPKEHGYSMKTHYNNKSFINYTDNVIRALREKYQSQIIVFEHGATSYGSLTACGTNHAHLHILPFPKSLLSLMQVNRTWQSCKISDIDTIVGNNEYLLYSEIKNSTTDSTFFVSIVSEPESQYFRKLISQQLGVPEAYDYKSNLNIDLAYKTHKTLKNEVFT